MSIDITDPVTSLTEGLIQTFFGKIVTSLTSLVRHHLSVSEILHYYIATA